jgi:hypothetical protein
MPDLVVLGFSYHEHSTDHSIDPLGYDDPLHTGLLDDEEEVRLAAEAIHLE